jgi:hypothetical protein
LGVGLRVVFDAISRINFYCRDRDRRRTFCRMSAGQVGVVGVSLAIILMIIAVVTLVWRNQVRRRRQETPQDRYRREIPDLQGGGIHPGGQPLKPPRPNNPDTPGIGGGGLG